MGKRKRGSVSVEVCDDGQSLSNHHGTTTSGKHLEQAHKLVKAQETVVTEPIRVQIIIGTYERILHGFLATIVLERSSFDTAGATFADTFLFNAHASAIRCLATSPRSNDTDRVLLASGGSDQMVNLYSLSCVQSSPPSTKHPPVSAMKGQNITENAPNREVGSLQHHAGGVNVLCFPTKSKLLTAADDNTIAVARTKDWTILSTIKVPTPKVRGQASGDTAPTSAGATGVNDLAIHPSMKLMISVGKGERCMRLWNLVTGKRAAVLNFDRQHLQAIGERKHSIGEGRKVRWNGSGEEFVVAFDRGCLIYGIDSKPKCYLLPMPRTKIHQIRYFTIRNSSVENAQELLALSTDDGRLLFYSTRSLQFTLHTTSPLTVSVPLCEPIAQLGGLSQSTVGRVKDFEMISLPNCQVSLIVTGSSDGAVRLWLIDEGELWKLATSTSKASESFHGTMSQTTCFTEEVPGTLQVGRLVDTYETGHRVTCLKALVMST